MKIAAIVTTGQADALLDVLRRGVERAEHGAQVRIFFRDESIPALCATEVAERLGWPELSGGGAESAELLSGALGRLKETPDVQLFACTSSMYVWGVSPDDLRAGVTGRGLIAFLADDLDSASEVWCI